MSAIKSFVKLDKYNNRNLMKRLKDSEYKLLICIVRQTLGFQRNSFKTNVTKLGLLTHKHRNIVRPALLQLENKKLITIERDNDTLTIYYSRNNVKLILFGGL